MLNPLQLAQTEIQDFVRQHENDDEQQLVLRHREILGVPSARIAEQINGRRKSKIKIPEYYNASGIIYPPGINLEQSSSSATGLLKSELLRQHSSHQNGLIDLTGGFGIDSYFMSQVFKQVHYIEPNEALLNIARHNHQALGAKNISHHSSTAESFLESFQEKVDAIYIDPSRRKDLSQKVFKFQDCEPDIVALKDIIFGKTKCLMVKASPLMDIQQGLRELEQVSAVYILAVDNECKEVLFLLHPENDEEPVVTAIHVRRGEQEHFSFLISDEVNAVSEFSSVSTYLYEPNAAILKAGAFKIIGAHYALAKLHPSTHLYTSNTLMMDFPGRIFEVQSLLPADVKVIGKTFPDGKANVVTRNYPVATDALRKKYKLIDGGEQYLLAFTAREEKHLCHARRLK